MEQSDIYKNKARFVKKLQNFYTRDCKNGHSIKRLDYVCEMEESEFIYVSFNSYSQKRIYVSGKNEEGMLLDFCRFLSNMDEYYWLLPADAAYRAELLEDE